MCAVSPGRILAGTSPGRIIVRGAAPRCIVDIGATSGRTIVRSTVSSGIPSRLSRCTRHDVQPCTCWCRAPSCTIVYCMQRGAPPCPHRCRARSYHSTRRGAMTRDTLPRRILVEMGNAGVGGVTPNPTVVAAPRAASCTIVRGAAPSRVLAGVGPPAVSSLEY